MAYVTLQYGTDCSYRTEPEGLLLQSLRWQMEPGVPTVLIVHSHATECYTKGPGQIYQESGNYRTKDTDHNMVAVGDALAALLEDRGIGVIHDRQLHDEPSYNAAYTSSRKSVEEYLAEYPSICLVLDLHRDAALNADGSQYATSATVNGERSAQLMLLAGTASAHGKHPNWKEILALALKLQVLLEKENPGIIRRTLLRGYVFNQDLCSGMLIVEVGTAGNTLQEALRAMPPLADAIAALKNGANCGQ
jgi:stage II sporulation protein P